MSSQYTNIAFFVVLIIAMYLMLIRPQQQQRQRRERMLSALKPGDTIITIGGIYATVVSMSDDRVRVRLSGGADLEVARGGIGQIVERDEAAQDEAAGESAEVVASDGTLEQNGPASDE